VPVSIRRLIGYTLTEPLDSPYRMSRINQHLELPGGRCLGYDEHGPLDGTPVFYFHGSPSTRLEWNFFCNESLETRLNVRVIAPDRPGLGRSDFQPGRRIADWPADVIALADRLELSSFGILAYSGGGPYAVVCALKIPERLTRVAIVSGTAPFDEPGLSAAINPQSLRFMQLSHTKPWLSKLTLRLMGLGARYAPRGFIRGVISSLPPPDRALLADPDFQRQFIAVIQDALRAGSSGAQWDTALMVSPWDFRPQDIKVAVQLWHGEEDTNAPVAMGRYMASAIPNSRAYIFPGEGHLSLMAKSVEEVLNVLGA
jgi:pimeloyl-ACP methyl ester carboxylesterase